MRFLVQAIRIQSGSRIPESQKTHRLGFAVRTTLGLAATVDSPYFLFLEETKHWEELEHDVGIVYLRLVVRSVYAITHGIV